MLDDKIKSILIKKLSEWGDEPINNAKLTELRELITKKTGKHKFLPYTNLKKWIKEVKKEMRATQKTTAVKESAEKKTAPVQTPVSVPARPVQTEEQQPKAVISPFADRVYFQNLTYELSSMRRALERISKQLDDLEEQLKEFKENK